MHKLTRGNAPFCLSKFRHGRDNWNDVKSEDRAQIWNELNSMQENRCAYCECDIKDKSRHIEHFRQKGRDATVTFLWENLFGSCSRDDCCGKHKDRCGAYDQNDLIKPDVDDPEKYLVFDSSGSVNPRIDLSAMNYKRAKETIRIFNLDGALRQIRQSEVYGYIQTAEFFKTISEEYPEEEWIPLLLEEVSLTEHLPFSTAIKHVLTRQSEQK